MRERSYLATVRNSFWSTSDQNGTVAIAYHLQKVPYVFPIIGGRKIEQLHENIAALDISLTAEQIKRIEDATPFDPGFPHSLIVRVFSCSICGRVIALYVC